MQSPSIVKPVLILTCTAVLLTAMHFAASFLVPVLLGIFFATLLTPIYRWFKNGFRLSWRCCFQLVSWSWWHFSWCCWLANR